ncbi:hypothetical protein J6590_018705 [Homalodisca vitripennis]|nr:hypothetical protein J6590_018705 [Homalodisca vitripennis]
MIDRTIPLRKHVKRSVYILREGKKTKTRGDSLARLEEVKQPHAALRPDKPGPASSSTSHNTTMDTRHFLVDRPTTPQSYFPGRQAHLCGDSLARLEEVKQPHAALRPDKPGPASSSTSHNTTMDTRHFLVDRPTTPQSILSRPSSPPLCRLIINLLMSTVVIFALEFTQGTEYNHVAW